MRLVQRTIRSRLTLHAPAAGAAVTHTAASAESSIRTPQRMWTNFCKCKVGFVAQRWSRSALIKGVHVFTHALASQCVPRAFLDLTCEHRLCQLTGLMYAPFRPQRSMRWSTSRNLRHVLPCRLCDPSINSIDPACAAWRHGGMCAAAMLPHPAARLTLRPYHLRDGSFDGATGFGSLPWCLTMMGCLSYKAAQASMLTLALHSKVTNTGQTRLTSQRRKTHARAPLVVAKVTSHLYMQAPRAFAVHL